MTPDNLAHQGLYLLRLNELSAWTWRIESLKSFDTDPVLGNFIYNPATKMLYLVDFGQVEGFLPSPSLAYGLHYSIYPAMGVRIGYLKSRILGLTNGALLACKWQVNSGKPSISRVRGRSIIVSWPKISTNSWHQIWPPLQGVMSLTPRTRYPVENIATALSSCKGRILMQQYYN
jgi:hypothetical protein